MKARWGWVRGPLLVTMLVGLMAVPDSLAKGSRGGRGGRAPRAAAPRRPNWNANANARAMTPRATHPAPHVNQGVRTNNMANNTRANSGQSHANTNTNGGIARSAASGTNAAQSRAINAGGVARSATTGVGAGASHANGIGGVAGLASATGTSLIPRSYTYGTGSQARQYHAYGNGRGYRNRSGGSGYGRSQGNSRAIVSRLRSVHTSLARLDHDYQGHRVRAMHSISMAVRQLSHRSMGTAGNGSGFASVGANGQVGATGRVGALANANGNANTNNANRNLNANGNNGNRRAARIPQAQSDSRMAAALRTTQGIHNQLGNQGQSSQGHSLARAHVARAARELNTALTVR